MSTLPTASQPIPIELVAHRGANRLRMENTLAAFALALDQGADAIELDVHATSDGVVIVHHDPDVADKGRQGAKRQRLNELSWDQAKAIRLSGDESMPRLAEVLALAESRARVYVEIKGERIEAAVVQTIRDSRTDCAVHSFDHDVIGRVRALAPELARGLLLDKGDVRGDDVGALIRRFGARDLWPHRSLIDDALVSAAHRAGARVVAWTVNAPPHARSLAALGVDALCTDDVPRVARAIGATGVD